MNAVFLRKRVAAEALGSLLLACVVVGSGIMGERLAASNAAIALLGNTLATVTLLGVLIYILGPLSGAHFNPIVTLLMRERGEISTRDALLYIAAQFGAMVLGTWLAHAMFGIPLMQTATHVRSSFGEGLGECVATFLLLFTIIGTLRRNSAYASLTVPAAIAAGYWFTSSTSFANPAITIARALTDSFAGIAPESVPLFVAGQCLGGFAAWALSGWLWASCDAAIGAS